MARSCNPAILGIAPFQVGHAQKHVCADHFSNQDFVDLNRRNKLKRDAIPKWNGKEEICLLYYSFFFRDGSTKYTPSIFLF